jgi:hypothetical protein
MKNPIPVAVVLLGCVISACAGQAAASDVEKSASPYLVLVMNWLDAAGDVEKSLKELNDAFVTRDAAALKRLMTDDHLSITSYAGKETRDKQIASLPSYKIQKYSTEGMKSQAVGKDAILRTYIVKYQGTFKGKPLPARSIASSLWVLRDGRWQELLYQETPVAKD